ncbi:glycoside hydrolase family 3 protein [Pseudoalteromonas phenolica]|uniref:glycoside hydrolase family 3 protein n=1 Tax=Pseudoalteromonas phenolica TaxID=161398 RepID=UPI00110AA8F0|nr:exo 1,3/1,4-beta-D-glucan glucohydrolase [Pseudoalteromonas phenolica]TMO58186.1 beta-glucosidase [Pseudoalteromonas phenolica]
MKRLKKSLVAVMVTGLLASCAKQSDTVEVEKSGLDIWPTINSEVKKDPEIERQVAELLANMTLEQKIAQMIQPEIRDITVEDMRRYGFGSYLNGGGAFPNNNKHSSVKDWVDLAEAMYQASVDDSLDGINIPTMWGTDAVHGHNNVIGATLFPHNIGLGAANNPDLIVKIAEVTAKEVMATGIDWVFAPTVATVRDDRWGRTYEGYSEDPEIVKEYAAAIVHGLQGTQGDNFLGDDRVISTVKHFVGDGGTVKGDDQGNNIDSELDLFNIHSQGYVGGLTAGAQSVMASFNSWNGEKIHGNKYLLTDVLKDKMGFDGFVVGDWNGHGQIKGCSNHDCPQAVNSGLDVYMVPTDAWKPLMENTIKQVRAGIIPMSRIDDAVTRILRVKFRAGLFDKSSPANRPYANKTELIGHAEHREVAKQAVRESLVLLKNNDSLLPLSPKQNILIAGDAANNIGKQSGGWTITWQGTNNENADFPGGSSIYDGLAEQIKAAGGKVTLSEDGSFENKPDVAIVVFGEEPYAEGHGDKENLVYQQGDKRDLALLQKLKAQGIPVISVFISGRPLWVNPELNSSDAFVAAWLPGSEGDAVADVLLTDKAGKVQNDFKGKLSFSWPSHPSKPVNRFDADYAPLLPYGFGLQYGDKSVLSNSLSEKVELDNGADANSYVFKGKTFAPWQMRLFSGANNQAVMSSSIALKGLEYRTIDKHIQEDAFKLVWTGQENAGMEFVSKSWFREDLSMMQASNAALVIELMRDGLAGQPVIISSHCESEGDKPGSCRAQVDITEQLNRLPDTQWQNLSIDLNCFAKQGLKYSQVIMPFAISTSGKANLSISDIHFAPEQGKSASIQCE